MVFADRVQTTRLTVQSTHIVLLQSVVSCPYFSACPSKHPRGFDLINEKSGAASAITFILSSFIHCALSLNLHWVSACFDRPPSHFCGCAGKSAGASTGKTGLASQPIYNTDIISYSVPPRMCNTWRASTEHPTRSLRYPLWPLS